MDEFENDPRCWGAHLGEWWSKPQDIALAHTPAFGQRFFAEVFNEFPTLATGVIFSRCSVQPEHLYALFELPSGGFCVQIDPYLEYIIVSGEDEQAEYGDWDCDHVALAIDHVRTLVWWFESLSNEVE